MSNGVTVCSNQACDSCPTSTRAAVYFPAVANATVENPELQIMSEESAQSYYVYSEVILSTALFLVENRAGEFIQYRALLDSGSQLSLVAQNCANRLRLPARHSHVHVSGVARTDRHTLHQVSSVTLKSCVEPNFLCTLETFIVPQVTGPIPANSFERGNWPHVTILTMADPDYNLSTTIDLLLGADCLPVVLRSGLKVGAVGQPVAQYTAFGWVLLGPVAVKVESTELIERERNQGTHTSGRNEEKTATQRLGPQGSRQADYAENLKKEKADKPERQQSRMHSNSALDWLLKGLMGRPKWRINCRVVRPNFAHKGYSCFSSAASTYN